MQSLFNRNFNNDIVVIAEVGVNHEGSYKRAKKLIQSLVKTDVDAIKLQSFSVEKYCSTSNMERFNMLKSFSLSREEHVKLAKIVHNNNKAFLSTPVTEDWVEFISEIGDAIKIASGDITFAPVLQKAALQKKPVILSTGASNFKEVERAINIFKKNSKEKKLIKNKLAILHCVSSYPANYSECNLMSIPFLKKKLNLVTGWSNHVLGKNINIAAVALGAQIIELHVTDDKKSKPFRDHALSYEVDELDQLIKEMRDIKKAIGIFHKNPSRLELKNVKNLRKGIVAARNIRKGERLTEKDLSFARPSIDFSSNDLKFVIGKTLKKSVYKGNVILKKNIK